MRTDKGITLLAQELLAFGKAYKCMGDRTVKSVIVYISEKRRVKLTRFRKPDRNRSEEDIRMSAGRPNWAERKFVKLCVKAGEPFPVKKAQLKFFPVKKK